MRVNDLQHIEGFYLQTKYHENTSITGIFCGDLLSLVMANIKEGNALLTVISNYNVLAIAHLMKIPCIIFTTGVLPKPELIQKAEEEDIAIVTTNYDTATAVKRLYEAVSI